MKSKLLSILIALLASFCLWIYVVTVVNQEVNNEPINGIPVTFSGADQILEDSNLIITEGDDTLVDLRVSCSRQTLTKLSKDSISVVVDVSRIKTPGEYTLPYTVVYPTGVSSSEVSYSGTPRNITFTVELFTSKSVPVRGILAGSVAEGYYAPALECTPNEIVISGPEPLVNKVSYAQVILERENLTETVTQSCAFTLIDSEGNAVESEYISASVDGVRLSTIEVRQSVLQMKDVPLIVEFLEGGGATAADVIWTCEPNIITIAGEQEVLEKINQITVAQYDLAKLVNSVSEDMPVTLPNDVINVTELETVRVNISINTNKLSTKMVRATNFEVINVPEGYTADVMTVQLSVTLRGPIEEINRISEGNITVVIDASSLHEGTQSVPAVIEISGGGSVGSIGEYTAVVSLTQESEE